jgi:hypothetical protein
MSQIWFAFHRTRTDDSSLNGLVRIKKWDQRLSEYQIHEKQEQLQEEDMDQYTLFVYGIRSPYTKESYLRWLRGFFDAINLDKDVTSENRI